MTPVGAVLPHRALWPRCQMALERRACRAATALPVEPDRRYLPRLRRIEETGEVPLPAAAVWRPVRQPACRRPPIAVTDRNIVSRRLACPAPVPAFPADRAHRADRD